MSFDGNNIPFAYLIQPELLEEHEIRNILIERCVRIDNIEHLNKEQLLNIFYRIITPLQQRTRNENCRRTDINGINKNITQFHVNSTLKNGISKSFSDENSAKKLKLCASPNKVQLKRSNTDKYNIEGIPVVKKARQKITWP